MVYGWGGTPSEQVDVVAPYARGKWQFVEETPDGDILATSQRQGIIKIGRDYDLKWRRLKNEMGDSAGNTAVWNYASGKILVSDPANGRVFRYDPETDTIELEITAFNEGGFGNPRANWEKHSYHAENETGRIWVADSDNHFVALFDENGNQVESYGTYGTAGDGSDLNSPHWVDGADTYADICDKGNDRNIKLDVTTGNIKWLHAYPDPNCIMHGTDTMRMITGVYFRPFIWCGDGPRGIPWWVSETCITPTRYGTFLGTHHGSVIEWDWRSAPSYQVPAIYPNLTAQSADTDLYVLPCMGWSRVVVEALSTAADVLNLYSLKTKGGNSEIPIKAEPDASGNLQWQTYRSIDMTADQVERFVFSNPAGVYGVRVTGTGTVDLRVHYEP